MHEIYVKRIPYRVFQQSATTKSCVRLELSISVLCNPPNPHTNMICMYVYVFFVCLIWDLGQFGMGHRIRTEILSRTHLLNVDLVNFLDFDIFALEVYNN